MLATRKTPEESRSVSNETPPAEYPTHHPTTIRPAGKIFKRKLIEKVGSVVKIEVQIALLHCKNSRRAAAER